MKKLMFLVVLPFLASCLNSSSPESLPSEVPNNTLLISSDGNIINYNLDENKIVWEYNSPIDSAGNRNYFVVDGQHVFMPFESGKFVNFDLNTGKIIWKHQIYEAEDDILGMAVGGEEEFLKEKMPLFMSKPLVDADNIIIASTGQPGQSGAWLYNFDRKTGNKKWHSGLPSVFNLFAPVRYRDYYFINSAVFLDKVGPNEGTSYSYGMFDGDAEVSGEPVQKNQPNQFEYPIYNQMQTDGKNLYIGDEKGKFYCFHLDKNANVPDGDITDPNNTFIKSPNIFKWTFNDPEFNFQSNMISFLKNGVLYVEMKNGIATKSCIFALNTSDGKVKWKHVVNGDVLNWSLDKDKIVGYTEKTIFTMDKDGQHYSEMKTESKPLSNIECRDKNTLVYITQKGIELFDTETKKSKILFAKPFNDKRSHNYVQIQYIEK